MHLRRSSGILAHITSLPTDFGIGDLGDTAYEFADFLAAARQSFWQILPIVPIGEGNSPYKSPSTFAGNTLLLSPTSLYEAGLISRLELEDARRPQSSHVHYAGVRSLKEGLLSRAHEAFEGDASSEDRSGFEAFCAREESWLLDYAFFEVISEMNSGSSWCTWDAGLGSYRADALAQVLESHAKAVRRVQFGQYLFQKQWRPFREHVNRLGIGLIGDLPIYVALDSADVWAQRSLFKLDDAGHPLVVAGVPPDYFSETGQYWGNPIYDWEGMDRSKYAWWVSRLRRLLDQVDLVRVDHFRGIQAYWEIPAEEETAVNGRWVAGPGARLLDALRDAIGSLPVIAEDLGIITDDVTELMHRFDLPGMAVLQFALMGGENDALLPERLGRDRIVYTGTHDNDTFLGWWHSVRNEASQSSSLSVENLERQTDTGEPEAERIKSAQRLESFTTEYLNLEGVPDHEIPWHAMESVFRSDARIAITPIQDVLSLDATARMNTPGTERGNWEWRLMQGQLSSRHSERLRQMTELCGRQSEG